MAASQAPRTTREKLELFRACFSGLRDVYGTYNPETGRVRQVKQSVSDEVILRHLTGQQPYGVYLLVRNRTRALAVDFDGTDLNPPMEFLADAKNYGVPTYIERSKAKGYHVWMFFEEDGVLAGKARRVAQHILDDVGMPTTEVFPKQDRLETDNDYGNFINAPLFGALVPLGRTVFIDERNPTQPYSDQWGLLESIQRIPESLLEDIMEINELAELDGASSQPLQTPSRALSVFGLPPCAQRMLAAGVGEYQRVSCFHLALQLKKAGLPQDIALAGLLEWATKNRPRGNKHIITKAEVIDQTRAAYVRDYRGCGCGHAAVTLYCQPDCPLQSNRRSELSPMCKRSVR